MLKLENKPTDSPFTRDPIAEASVLWECKNIVGDTAYGTENEYWKSAKWMKIENQFATNFEVHTSVSAADLFSYLDCQTTIQKGGSRQNLATVLKTDLDSPDCNS